MLPVSRLSQLLSGAVRLRQLQSQLQACKQMRRASAVYFTQARACWPLEDSDQLSQHPRCC